uniref:C2H2-type domain-containing protein n=1 Tax=Anguilla anguilla TaxID=7936 RepID=A0A0E9V0X0_ANGAN
MAIALAMPATVPATAVLSLFELSVGIFPPLLVPLCPYRVCSHCRPGCPRGHHLKIHYLFHPCLFLRYVILRVQGLR